MMLMEAGAGALDYFPCRYGASKAVFRGPARDLTVPYVAVLGGSGAFGRYVARPYSDLVEAALDRPVANLAALNAGPDFYLSDPDTLKIAAGAAVAVVQVTGAEALSNPFYTVHSRRNDRFLAATPALRDLYPEVDFADIHFTRHLLQVLRRADVGRFATVVRGLQEAWLDRMRALLARLPERRMLLWVTGAGPDSDPLFIDRVLIEALRPKVPEIVAATPSARARAMAPFDMSFPETEAAQAACLPGAAVHAELAEVLVAGLQGLL
jgi:Domain of unknown function (DUF6473)